MSRLFLLFLIPPLALGCASVNASAKGHYAPVNGLQMYYEIHGTGKPLVLIHGTSATIESSFGKVLPLFAKTRQVIAVEMQAHGHTADIDRPLTFEQMADDTAALLRYLNIKNADFVGWSMGGNIALQIGIRHPELVNRMVVSGSSFQTQGMFDEVVDSIRTATPENVPAEFRKDFERVAPKPEQWPAQIARVKKLWLEWIGFRPEEIQSIRAPVMVMIGDADAVRPEHALQMFRLLQRGASGPSFRPNSPSAARSHTELAVLPSTGHATFQEHPAWVVSMIDAFLDAKSD